MKVWVRSGTGEFATNYIHPVMMRLLPELVPMEVVVVYAGRGVVWLVRARRLKMTKMLAEGLELAAEGADDVVKVFRVYGGKAKPRGFSWTPVNPNSVNNFSNGSLGFWCQK